MIISIDHGNKNCKTLHKTFTSGLQSSTVPFPLCEETLYYNGKYYTLTEDRIPYMRDKTSNEQFFILTLFAIASELEYSGQYVPGSTANIELAIGLPPGHYGKQYKEFEKYFERNSYINFEYKGTKYKIFISSAVSYPQGYAAIVPKIDEIKNYSRAMIIDIGGFSLDYLQIKNGIADMAVCDSLEMGVITFYNDIKSSINSSEDILIDESDIDAIILGKDSVFEQKIKTLIDTKAQEFTDKIINSLRERKIDLKSTHAIFTGGGSILLKKYILSSPKIAKPDIIDDIRANAKGYDIMLRRQPGRM